VWGSEDDVNVNQADKNMDWVVQLGCSISSLKEAAKLIKSTNDYYVYIIWKMYTDKPVPFYVGKGHLQRLIKHEMESEFIHNAHKTRIIRKHKRVGVDCGYSVIDFFGDEEVALAAEVDLIALIGRHDLKLGPLANRTDGGDGTRGHLSRKRGLSASARRIVANGKQYACLNDAADALQVTSGAVSGRIKSGWDGYFYEDEGQKVPDKIVLGRYRKEVVVDRKKFRSASEASRMLEMDVRMISKRVAYGWDGYFYVTEGQKPRRSIWGSRIDKVGVTVHGIQYETIAAAVLATGESNAKISKRCLSSNYPAYLRHDGLVEEKLGSPRSAQQVIVGIERFKSISQAAEQFQLTEGGVSYRCRSQNYPEWKFEDEAKQKAEAFTPRFSSAPVCVVIDGVSFRSQSEAATKNKIDISTLKRRCKSLSFPQWICVVVEKTMTRDGRPGLIAVVVDGIRFRSVSEAGARLGIPRSIVLKRLNSDDWPSYQKGV
jgi:hypothetical protein